MFAITLNLKEFIEDLGFEVQMTETINKEFFEDLSSVKNKTVVFLPVNHKMSAGTHNDLANKYSRKYTQDIYILIDKRIRSNSTTKQQELAIERMTEIDKAYQTISEALANDQNTLGQCYSDQASDFINYKESIETQSSAKISFEFEYYFN